jgi:hypothetical protein
VRADRGWDDVDLDAALTPALRAAYEQWEDRHRARWTPEDVAAVACAGLIGIAAIWFDATIDSAVRDRLKHINPALSSRVRCGGVLNGWRVLLTSEDRDC